MTKVNFSVVFMGNGPVAAKSLELLKEWANIEFVITKRRPQHHKDPAPVEEYCKSHNLPYFYANNKQELQNIVESSSPSSKVAVVVDYGVIINKETINFFNKGIINSHFSLLPAWRGADPITFSILSGQKNTWS
jgi:methionyl-tRNA formyltransferase